MKHPLRIAAHGRRHFIAGPALLPAVTCAVAGSGAGAEAGSDLSYGRSESAYTILFCVWFLLLGAIEFFVLRFVWRRWFSLAS